PGTQPEPGTQPQGPSREDLDSLQRIGELLQQQSRQPVSPDAGTSPMQTPAAPGTDSGSGSQQEQEQQKQAQQQRERVAEQLEQQGFGRTLRNLLNEARREADSAEQRRREELQREQQMREEQAGAGPSATDGKARTPGSPGGQSPELSPQQMINDLMKQIQEEQRKR
ncbi:MAG: hypothetical protein ACK5YO_19525, partial [Planctomyces sp.]